MHDTLLDWKKQLEDKPILRTWKTDKGEEIKGLLSVKSGRLQLDVLMDDLKKRVEFDHIIGEETLGGMMILYPSPDPTGTNKVIPSAKLSDSWPVDIHYLMKEDPHRRKFLGDNLLEVGIAPFVFGRIKSTSKYGGREYNSIVVETSIGKVSLNFAISEGFGAIPPSSTRSLREVSFSIQFSNAISHGDAFMWHRRIHDFVAFICQEEIPTNSLTFPEGAVFMPGLADEYNRASYAYRQPIGVRQLREMFRSLIKNYVEQYDTVGAIMGDLCKYYADYSADIPDDIQLLRLFTSLERASDHARSNVPALKKKYSTQAIRNEREYARYVKTGIKDKNLLSRELLDFINQSKKYYKERGETPDSRKKIHDLGNLMYDKYEINNSLIFEHSVKTLWNMRNVIAHGLNDKENKKRKEFYKNNDHLRQEIEQVIRAYLLRLMGSSKKMTTNYSKPLRAIVHSVH